LTLVVCCYVVASFELSISSLQSREEPETGWPVVSGWLVSLPLPRFVRIARQDLVALSDSPCIAIKKMRTQIEDHKKELQNNDRALEEPQSHPESVTEQRMKAKKRKRAYRWAVLRAHGRTWAQQSIA